MMLLRERRRRTVVVGRPRLVPPEVLQTGMTVEWRYAYGKVILSIDLSLVLTSRCPYPCPLEVMASPDLGWYPGRYAPLLDG
jgi:hypothetical protein